MVLLDRVFRRTFVFSVHSFEVKQNMKKRLRMTWMVSGLVFAMAWLLVGLVREPRAEWCEVTYPSWIENGQHMPITVQYTDIQEDITLSVGLHWYTKNKKRQGHLRSAAPHRLEGVSGVYTFNIPIEDRVGLAFVSIVLYLSHTGQWADRIQAAHSDLIPVRNRVRSARLKTAIPYIIPNPSHISLGNEGDGASGSEVDPLSPFQSTDAVTVQEKWISFFGYAAAALLCILCVFRCRGNRNSITGTQSSLPWLVALVIVLFLSADALFEFRFFLTDLNRMIARGQGWYEQRNLIQRTMVGGTLSVGTAVLLMLFSQRGGVVRGFRLAYAGSLFLIGFYVIRFISFHPVDKILSYTLIGIDVSLIMEILGIICVILSSVFGSIHEKPTVSTHFL